MSCSSQSSLPEVSVIIPSYNRADLLPQTVESVLGQSFRNLEVIVVDDGSTDGTGSYVTGLDDPRVRYFLNEWSGLPAVNRNTGLKAARGRMVAFVDSDDLWLPDKLQKQVAYLESHQEFMWCFCHFGFLNHETGTVTDRPFPVGRTDTALSPLELIRRNVIGSPTPLLKKELFEKVGGFNESAAIRFFEDWEMWLRIAAYTPPGVIAEPLALYRRHTANSTAQQDPYEACLRHLAVLDSVLDCCKDTYGPMYDEAIRAGVVEYVRELLVRGERRKAAELCEVAFSRPLSFGRLNVFRLLSRLPSVLTSTLLKGYRLGSSVLRGQAASNGD